MYVCVCVAAGLWWILYGFADGPPNILCILCIGVYIRKIWLVCAACDVVQYAHHYLLYVSVSYIIIIIILCVCWFAVHQINVGLYKVRRTLIIIKYIYDATNIMHACDANIQKYPDCDLNNLYEYCIVLQPNMPYI